MNKKTLSLIGIIFVFSLVFIPLVSADAGNGVFDNNSVWVAGTGLDIVNADNYAIAQDFNASYTGAIDTISVALKKVGTPTGNIQCQIFSMYSSGVYGSGNANTRPDALLANSTNVISLASLTTSFVDYYFQFDNYEVTANTKLWLVISVQAGGSLSGANYLEGMQDNPGTHYGEYSARMDSVWYTSGVDLRFLVVGDPVPEVTPTPTPSPTPEAMPNWISDIIDAIIPIFTPLLVIFICGALGWRFAGAWGFFAGINLAIILVYVIAPTYMPLWAIVAVVIVDIALLFGKVGFDRR